MDTPVRVYLKAGREKSVHRRHPWIFSGAVERVEGDAAPGATARVSSRGGEFLAYAAYSPASQIRLRVWSFDADAVIDAAFLEQRLGAAIEARRAQGLLGGADACRVVFAEADGLPGLVVDRYGSYLVCQFLTAGAQFWRAAVLDALEKLLAPRGIYERSEGSARRKEGLGSARGLLRGTEPPAPLELALDGVLELVDISEGQKTGAYLDQRENRRRVAAYARAGHVLDAYAYTGAFALRCLRQGAARATLIDSSAKALQAAAEAARRNDLAGRCRYVEADVGEALRGLREAGERFDLVILDPPKFVHAAAQVQAGSRAYKDVNRLALELVRGGGALATFSCSGHVDAALFQKIVAAAALEARRDAQIVERLSQPPDHPVGIHFPEAEYLKGLVLRVSSN